LTPHEHAAQSSTVPHMPHDALARARSEPFSIPAQEKEAVEEGEGGTLPRLGDVAHFSQTPMHSARVAVATLQARGAGEASQKDETPSYAQQLARARALLHARLPADLATWIEEQLAANVPNDYIRARRDAWLHQAAAIIGGSVNHQAVQILALAKVLERCWSAYRVRSPEPGTAFGAVHHARLLMPVPKRRQLINLLSKSVQSSPL